MAMSPDEQEARSRRLSNDVIMLLPLSSGRVAVFNRGGDLCGIAQHPDKTGIYEACDLAIWEIMRLWHPPTKREARPNPTLEELFK
jgi:hypothetical protein